MAKTNEAPIPASLMEAMPAYLSIESEINSIARQFKELDRAMASSAAAGAIPLAKAFVVLRRLKDRVELMDKAFSIIFERYKTEIVPATFEAAGISSVPLTEGFRVGTSSTLYASIRKDMRDEAYEWLRANNLGSLIVETVNAGTLAAAARAMEDENQELPDGIFNTYYQQTTSVTATGRK